jgi:amino acid transporter
MRAGRRGAVVRAAGWWALSAVLVVVALLLAWAAFTRFSGEPGPAPGTPGFDEYESARIQEAWWSVGLGAAAAFTLLGAFACFNRASPADAKSVGGPAAEPRGGEAKR